MGRNRGARGRRAAGGVARSLQPAEGDAPPSLLAIRPSASTRDPSQYFNSLLALNEGRGSFLCALPEFLCRGSKEPFARSHAERNWRWFRRQSD